MVTRKRLNLSMSEHDFSRLQIAAKMEGKLPTAYALDLLKLSLSKIKLGYIPSVGISEPSKRVPAPLLSPDVSAPVVEPVMTRQQRRALDRMQKKGKK